MVDNTSGDIGNLAAQRSEIWRRYTRLLRDYTARPDRETCLAARCWRDIAEESLDDFGDRLSRVPAITVARDVIDCIDSVVLGLAPGANLAGDAGASLLVQMALVTVERWLNAEIDLSRFARDGIPVLPLLTDTVAAMVAASCLGLNLNLKVRIDSSGTPELEITNLLTDAAELQLGRIDAPQAIGNALLKRALPSRPGAAPSALPTDDFVFDRVARHARKTGARLIVGLPGEHHDLARQVAVRWGVGVFVRSEAAPGGVNRVAHPLIALQNDVKQHLDMVLVALAAQERANLHLGQPLQAVPRGPAPLVFISYAHEDRALRQEFEQHLNTYVVNASLALWTDDLIGAGSEWKRSIQDGIEGCAVAVLLLTPNFMGSSFIINSEMAWLRQRHDRQEIRIVPILMQPCDAAVNTWLAARQVKPAIDQPVPAPHEGHARIQTLTSLAKTVHQYANPTTLPRTLA